ncbi:PPOX class F420-dependent enzyme [Marmoricola endophyticus]|uniref:PPOX class F420-dependent enzyme n=1 Tax=Marmoricola endophyticus TaxID=2040280 RepID=A0A917BI39_9ACTN|nr:PPOX class F420-dependent oxidoreductase [Marmoricola endophyticus]GGF46695.1 PPOX class F420-dependent enzyme [Marmoricola endophyticus]
MSRSPLLDEMGDGLREFWTERHLCTLTTLRSDGSPHVVAVGCVLDPEQGCAWVITSGSSRKARNVAAGDPAGGPARVSVAQVDGRRWSSVEGTAEVRTDAESVAHAEQVYAGRYRQPRENPARVALRITPTRVLAGPSLR